MSEWQIANLQDCRVYTAASHASSEVSLQLGTTLGFAYPQICPPPIMLSTFSWSGKHLQNRCKTGGTLNLLLNTPTPTATQNILLDDIFL